MSQLTKELREKDKTLATKAKALAVSAAELRKLEVGVLRKAASEVLGMIHSVLFFDYDIAQQAVALAGDDSAKALELKLGFAKWHTVAGLVRLALLVGLLVYIISQLQTPCSACRLSGACG